MKEPRQPRSFSSTEEFLQDLVKDLIRLLGGFTLLPQAIALVPGPGRRQSAPGTTRGTPPARTSIRPLLLGFVLVAAHEVLCVADRMKLGRYEIVLTPQQGPAREAQGARADQPAVRCSRETKAAA